MLPILMKAIGGIGKILGSGAGKALASKGGGLMRAAGSGGGASGGEFPNETDFGAMSDEAYEKYLMTQGLGGKGIDFDSMGQPERERMMAYLQSKPNQGIAPGLMTSGMQMGMQAPSSTAMMTGPAISPQALMAAATQGIKRVPYRRGLMENF